MSAITLTFGDVLDPANVVALSETEVNTLLRGITSVAISDLWISERAAFHQYEGLDVTFIRRHWKQLQITGTGGTPWTEAQLATNIREIIIIGMVFGNVTDNNFHKRSDDSQNFINDILQRCHIVQHVSANNKRTAVTINRTMIAFATETVNIARILGRDYSEGPATKSLAKLPKYMKTTVFPSVLPDFVETKVGVFILVVFTIWSGNMNLIINRRGPTRRKRNFTDEEFKDSYMSQYSYAEIAYGSNAFEAPRMKAFLVHHGIAGQYANFKEVYDAETTRLALPPLDVSAAEWATAWA